MEEIIAQIQALIVLVNSSITNRVGCGKITPTILGNRLVAILELLEELAETPALSTWIPVVIEVDEQTDIVTSEFFEGEVFDVMFIDFAPLGWAENGIVHDPDAGTMDFTSIGGIDGSVTPVKIAIQYKL